MFVGDAWCVPHIECVLYIVCILLQWICTGPYRILPTQCVVNNPGSCWHYRQSSGWCYQALHRVYCVVCCIFIISVGCLLRYVLWVLYGVYWARLYTASTMWFVYVSCLSLHYCHRNVLCMFFVVLHYCQRSMLCMLCSCCTTVSAGCYVLVCVCTTCQCRVLCMSCFVLHYCQHSVPCMSCLCCSTSSAVCYVCVVCVALLAAKCAAVEHCKCSVPLLNTVSAVCRCWTLQVQYAAVKHCKRSVLLLNTASAVCRCWTLPAQWAVWGLRYVLFSFLFSQFYYFYPFSLVGNGWVQGSSIITASNLIFPVMYLGKRKCQVLQSNIPQLSFFSSHPSIHCCTHIIKAIPLD